MTYCYMDCLSSPKGPNFPDERISKALYRALVSPVDPPVHPDQIPQPQSHRRGFRHPASHFTFDWLNWCKQSCGDDRPVKHISDIAVIKGFLIEGELEFGEGTWGMGAQRNPSDPYQQCHKANDFNNPCGSWIVRGIAEVKQTGGLKVLRLNQMDSFASTLMIRIKMILKSGAKISALWRVMNQMTNV